MIDTATTGKQLLNPGSTAAIVLGAHDWTAVGLERAPSFLRSARRFVQHLYDPAGLGLDPELVLDLFDNTASANDQLAELQETLDQHVRERSDDGRPLTDVLLYYIGHGHPDEDGQLSLLVRRSRRNLEVETGIKTADLARTLRVAAPQQRRLVILDCCFSERASRSFIGMSGGVSNQVAAVTANEFSGGQPARGTLVLCSSGVGLPSIAKPNAEHTLFSGAVLEVLQRGAQGYPSNLSFSDLRDAAFDRMLQVFGANAPRPVLHQANASHGDLTRAPAFPNRATKFLPLKEDPQERPSQAATREEARTLDQQTERGAQLAAPRVAELETERSRTAEVEAEQKRATEVETERKRAAEVEAEQKRAAEVEVVRQAERLAKQKAAAKARRAARQAKRQADAEAIRVEEHLAVIVAASQPTEDCLVMFAVPEPGGLRGINKLAKWLQSLKADAAINDWHIEGRTHLLESNYTTIRFDTLQDARLAYAKASQSIQPRSSRHSSVKPNSRLAEPARGT